MSFCCYFHVVRVVLRFLSGECMPQLTLVCSSDPPTPKARFALFRQIFCSLKPNYHLNYFYPSFTVLSFSLIFPLILSQTFVFPAIVLAIFAT